LKKLSIRTAIILPVVVLMILMPFTTYFFFGRLMESYVRNQSYKDMAQAAHTIINAAGKSAFSDIEKEDAEKAVVKEQIKEFAALIKELVRARKFNVRVLIVNSKWNISYPTETFADDYNMLSYFKGRENEIIAAENFNAQDILEVPTDSGNSLAIACHLGRHEKVRTRYLIMYHPIENIDQIKHSAAKIAFGVTALFSVLTVAILYLISNHIVRPLKEICNVTKKIGSGQFIVTGVKSKIGEIGEIASEIDAMAVKLAKSDVEQKIFFQNASHELRTPLMSIRGYAEGIECGLFKDDKAAGKIITEECARLSALVEDILSLSRMDNKRQETDLQKIDIYAFLNGCIKRFDALALQKALTLSVSGEEGQFIVEADESLLSKIFDNLFTNAIRYAKTNISVAIYQKAQNIIVLVENDGNPIAQEDLEKIFLRFYKGVGGNFGIGLSVAKTCAEYMGGYLRAIPSDKGAVFEATLVKYTK
jgi:signal transduction histidine kinase